MFNTIIAICWISAIFHYSPIILVASKLKIRINRFCISVNSFTTHNRVNSLAILVNSPHFCFLSLGSLPLAEVFPD